MGTLPDPLDDAAFRARLTFHAGTDALDGADASWETAGNSILTWSPSGLTWADMQTIAVRLTMSVPGIDSITFSDAGTDGAYAVGDAVSATVTFNEAVDVTGTPQLEIDAGGTPETLGYSSGSGTAALVFTGYTVAAGEEDTDGLAVAGNKLTLDGGTIRASAGGNPDAVLDHDAVPASANHRVDGVKPTLVTTGGGAPKPSSDGTKVILTFSEAIGSVDRTRITVESGTTTLSTTADSMSGATVEITLTTALTSSDTSVTVELAADAVEDLAGNGIAAVAATTVSVEDNTPPTLTGASTVSNDTVQLSYDEALDLTSQPAGSAFTVKVGGRARPVITVSFSGNRHVNLILGSAFRPGDTVTVSYSAPETGPIQDVARNAAASFADEVVTNDLAATAPEAPGFLGATPDIISAVPVRLYADRILLAWATPWNNGSDIMKFQVRHVEGSTAGGAWTDIDNSDGNTTTHTVTGLTADTEYTFEVRAVNGIEEGAEVTVMATTATPTWALTLTDSDGNAVTQLTEGGPSATATVSIANGVRFSTDQTVALEWNGLDIRVGLIQGAGGTDTITIPAGESSGSLEISAPELGGSAVHQPRVTRALTAVHEGSQVGNSIDLSFVDDEPATVATITGAPTTVDEGENIEVEITLNPASGASGNVKLTVNDDDSALSGTLPTTELRFSFGQRTNTITLTAADNEVQNDGAREVTFTLALNPNYFYTLGDPSSVTVTVLDNDTPPSAPRNLAAEARDGEARLRWQAPLTDNGQAVTGYEYRHKAGTGSFGAWTDILGSNGNTTEYTVKSLTNRTLYTFEVQAENTAGQSGPSNQASATPVAGDTTAPVLMSATTTALELGLTYDESLDANSEPAPSAFSVTVDGASRAVTGVSVGAKVLLTLASVVRAGDLVRVSYTVPAMNPLRDEANNPAAAFADHPVTNEVPATAPDAPTGLTAEAGDGSVTLRWTASAHDGGSEVTGHQYRQKTTGGFGSWQDIELSAPGEANATSYPVTSLMNDAAYTFEVQARNAEADSGPSNQASATPVAGDSTAPMLRSATTTALALGLTYDEALDADSEPAPSAFSVTVDGASRAVTGVSVGAKVLLTLASAVRAGDLVRVSYTVPAMNPLRDEANNPAAAFADHPVTNEVPTTAPEAPTGLAAIPGDGSVTLRWTASAHDGGREVTGHQYRHKTTGGFGSWQDIELSAPGEANATSYPVTSLANDTAYTFEVQARNAEGASGPSNQASATPVAGDSTAPVLRSATTTALALGLTYDENLDADSEPAPSAFTVTVDGASRAVTGVSVGTKALLTLASAVRAGETVTVSYAVPMTGPLQDEARNPAAAFSDHPVTNEVPATAPDAPTGLAATRGDGSVTLRWTASAHDGGSEVTGHQYRHKTTGGFGSWQDIELSAPGEANATSYPVTSLMNDTAYTFEVQARNAEGDSGPSNQARATPVAGDTTAPMLRSATTTALALGLTYDEDLDADSEPAPSAFTVTVDGASRAVTGVSVDGTKVVLTLATAVRAGETVTVTYAVPAMNPLRDEARNPAASFSDHPVTNGTPATAPDAPTSLEATPGDSSVTLRWTAPAYDGGRAVTGHQYCREEGPSASCTAESDWRDIADSAPGGANATGYTVSDLTNGTGYTFRVRARNAEGESGPSNEAGTTLDASDTASPELVRALSAGFGRMVGSQALRMVSAHLESGGGTQVTVGGERLAGPAEAALARLEAASRDGDEGRTRAGREALLGSSFRLQSGGEETGAAAWGRIAAGRFETRSDGVATDGEVTTGMVGADVTSGRWLVGGALSHARGKGSFASSAERVEGEAETRLTALHPYARVRLGERMSAWGLAGYGKGELALSGADGKWVETGLRMRMGAVGARGTVVPAPAGGGFELALKADALWMRVSSEAAEGLPGERADARRLRLVLDASRVVETAGGATLTPRFEAGVRRDGGDTQNGAGLEVGAGLRYARSAVTVEGRVRALALHEASGYEEWGASGSVRVEPSGSGRGLSLTLAPTWGDAASAVERLWSLRDAGGLAANAEFEPRARLDAELGYGLKGPRGVGVATPWAGLGLAREGERAWRAGARWKLAPRFTLGLEATRHEPSTNDPPEHRLMLRGALRW